MAVALTSAHYPCGPSICNPYYSCVLDNAKYGCIYRCEQVTITQQVINSWADNNGKDKYVQVQVTVHNNGPRNVNNVIIGAADGTLKLKDNNAIWGVVSTGNDLTLPSYASTINAGQSYTFGYINRVSQANLYVKNFHML
ncbi:cellulose-binding domain-containing protein [Heterostelium album PN500]|uniref:Cellulose-binding domain-containing protein n=1 Tax=Heterostelium pallidum (strain ATCC 26659 / Pp 5 / PN500) TaxID=670386 RepID=D3B2R0_HETP5|nr:cellulose-binding domain-containing protein [Heterostelium album PN500]EFA83608.1 cellulose-binding domain-containing protein [Heterostelium album PN500]|eukprot:XP_020435725.1 cellulose-binding domain-containing protein [Heterostelium album PN500]